MLQTSVCPTLFLHEPALAAGARVDNDWQTPRTGRRQGRGRREPPPEAATPRHPPVSATRTQSVRSRPVAVWLLVAVSPATPHLAGRRDPQALDATEISRRPQAAEPVPTAALLLRCPSNFFLFLLSNKEKCLDIKSPASALKKFDFAFAVWYCST